MLAPVAPWSTTLFDEAEQRREAPDLARRTAVQHVKACEPSRKQVLIDAVSRSSRTRSGARSYTASQRGESSA